MHHNRQEAGGGVEPSKEEQDGDQGGILRELTPLVRRELVPPREAPLAIGNGRQQRPWDKKHTDDPRVRECKDEKDETPEKHDKHKTKAQNQAHEAHKAHKARSRFRSRTVSPKRKRRPDRDWAPDNKYNKIGPPPGVTCDYARSDFD